MEIHKRYKFILKNKSVFTAKIKEINENFIVFTDKNNIERGIRLEDIKSYREITFK